MFVVLLRLSLFGAVDAFHDDMHRLRVLYGSFRLFVVVRRVGRFDWFWIFKLN